MNDFLLSTGIVALAEIGDKTHLLSLVLATRFHRPWPIVAGILAGTLLNHAGALGAWLVAVVGPVVMRWILGVSFLALAGRMIIPDTSDADDVKRAGPGGVFLTTTLVFFRAETGDSTQVATIALAARLDALAFGDGGEAGAPE